VELATRTREMRSLYRIVFWKCERKTELGRPSGMWKDNIKMGIKELCCGCAKRICMAQYGQVACGGGYNGGTLSGVCCLTEGLSASLSRRLLLQEASYDC
jgi:hypothetical protein